MADLADRVRTERERRGLSARTAASVSGVVSNTLWSRFEQTGNVTPKVRRAVSLVFGWPMDWPENPPAVSGDDVAARLDALERAVLAIADVTRQLAERAGLDGPIDGARQVLDDAR